MGHLYHGYVSHNQMVVDLVPWDAVNLSQARSAMRLRSSRRGKKLTTSSHFFGAPPLASSQKWSDTPDSLLLNPDFSLKSDHFLGHIPVREWNTPNGYGSKLSAPKTWKGNTEHNQFCGSIKHLIFEPSPNLDVHICMIVYAYLYIQ